MNKPFSPLPEPDLASLEADLARGWGLPVSWYTSPETYAFEMEHIFNRNWLLFAPIHQLAEPGDTVIGWAGSTPVVVVRGRDGRLRGFVNLCRHRGYTVATESGRCSLLTCRYHAWTYNLDGTLRGAPNTRDEPGFDRAEMSLLPVAVDSWGPAVFVNADPESPPLAEAHPRLDPYVASIEFRSEAQYYLDTYQVVREIHYDFNSNWKLWYDNNTECYHCPTIHSGSFGDAFETTIGAFDYAEIDRFMTFSFHPGTRPRDEGKLKAGFQRAFQLYPGATIMLQDDILLMHQAMPTGPETTRKVMYCLARKDADQDLANRWIDLWHQTFTEDQAATQVQQAGLRSGRMPRARYVTKQEEATVFVNKLTLQAYRAALTAG